MDLNFPNGQIHGYTEIQLARLDAPPAMSYAAAEWLSRTEQNDTWKIAFSGPPWGAMKLSLTSSVVLL